MSKITISSLNVRSLVNNEKRREVFHWLKKQNFSIYLLQEAHCTQKSSEIWAAEWGYTAFISSLASNKVGVAILFNNNFPFKILRQLCDKEGRYIILDLESWRAVLDSLQYLCSNTDDPAFFKNVSEQMLAFQCNEIIIGGDFNLVLDVSIDEAGEKPTTHWNSLKELKYIQENLDLTDIWRDLNPEIRRYTSGRNRPEVHCRLDFFLVSLSIARRVSNVNILPAYETDHSLCKIDINFHFNPRGPGFWKLNSALLSEVDYVNAVKQTIAKTAREYESDEEVDEVLLWEMIKLKISQNVDGTAKVRKIANTS